MEMGVQEIARYRFQAGPNRQLKQLLREPDLRPARAPQRQYEPLATPVKHTLALHGRTAQGTQGFTAGPVRLTLLHRSISFPRSFPTRKFYLKNPCFKEEHSAFMALAFKKQKHIF